ncbi:hypothetical protein HDE_14293 [Halotydeus destructor]|nr:hypothetical protein HDE_14293 [Halotydeus destructor]
MMSFRLNIKNYVIGNILSVVSCLVVIITAKNLDANQDSSYKQPKNSQAQDKGSAMKPSGQIYFPTQSQFSGHCRPGLVRCTTEGTTCLQHDGAFRCMCVSGYVYYERLKRCTEKIIIGETCISNEECKSSDTLSHCDYGPVFRHESPICQCLSSAHWDVDAQRCKCTTSECHALTMRHHKLLVPFKLLVALVTLVVLLIVSVCMAKAALDKFRRSRAQRFSAQSSIVLGHNGAAILNATHLRHTGDTFAGFRTPPPSYEEAIRQPVLPVQSSLESRDTSLKVDMF